jgi:DNA repair protein RecN (Recombination protein N)
MLRSLLIRNYAIIDQLEINWHKEFTVITGETGAGKSIIIGALQLVLGNRADVKVLRNPEEKCMVEVVFQCSAIVQNILKDKFDIEPEDEFILRREILPSGKSRSFVNDSPALVSDIQQMAPFLIGIHQQFDHLDFFDRNYQLNILDMFSGIQDRVAKYKKEYKQYQDLLLQKKEIEEKIRQALTEKEFVEFQFSELDAAALKENELNVLEEELKVISKSEEIKSNSSQSYDLIQRESGALDQVQECLNLLKNIRVSDNLKSIYERLDALRTELKDISRELERVSDESEFSAEKINTINQRVDLLNRLLKKHRVQSDNELIAIRDQLKSKLDLITTSDESLESLNKNIEAIKKELATEAVYLSKQRNAKSAELIKQTHVLLNQLGMEFAKFNIQLTTSDELKETGTDQIDFLFSANKGGVLRPIKDQASGGELARFNLAIKSQVAKKIEAGCLIFDEIDTGVSGQIALQMGNILKQMATYQQVICITHSPQVASRAKHHYYVYKEHKDKKTNTNIKLLNTTERLNELAKMLSGEPPTKAALKNASELIAMA